MVGFPLFINEIFAASVAFGRTGVNCKVATLKENFFNSFLHNLRYRLLTGDMLSIMYYLVEDASN